MFTYPVFYVGYFVAALLVGLLGLERRIGVLGFFLLALIFTPPLIFLILILTRPKALTYRHRKLESD